jgi:hypothetical protein
VNRCLWLGHWIGGYGDGVGDRLFHAYELFLYYGRLTFSAALSVPQEKNTRSD